MWLSSLRLQRLVASTLKPIGLLSGYSSRNAWILSGCFLRIQLLTWQSISSLLSYQYLWYVNRSSYINASPLLTDIDIRSSNAFETQVCCLWCYPHRSAVSFLQLNANGQHIIVLTSFTEQSLAESREWSYSLRSWLPHVSKNFHSHSTVLHG